MREKIIVQEHVTDKFLKFLSYANSSIYKDRPLKFYSIFDTDFMGPLVLDPSTWKYTPSGTEFSIRQMHDEWGEFHFILAGIRLNDSERFDGYVIEIKSSKNYEHTTLNFYILNNRKDINWIVNSKGDFTKEYKSIEEIKKENISKMLIDIIE